jgi:hypothetical protein
MSIVTGKFTRKSFNVEAIQVTAENMAEVAEWCGGTKKDARDLPRYNASDTPVWYIQVPVVLSKAKTFRPDQAFVNSWVVKTGQGFAVYTKKGFGISFEPTDENKFEAVLKLVKDAMSRQDVATYHGESRIMDGVDEEITHQIFEILL